MRSNTDDLIEELHKKHEGIEICSTDRAVVESSLCFMSKLIPVLSVFYDPSKYDNQSKIQDLLASLNNSLSGFQLELEEGVVRITLAEVDADGYDADIERENTRETRRLS
jgi:hypothetical protein